MDPWISFRSRPWKARRSVHNAPYRCAICAASGNHVKKRAKNQRDWVWIAPLGQYVCCGVFCGAGLVQAGRRALAGTARWQITMTLQIARLGLLLHNRCSCTALACFPNQPIASNRPALTAEHSTTTALRTTNMLVLILSKGDTYKNPIVAAPQVAKAPRREVKHNAPLFAITNNVAVPIVIKGEYCIIVNVVAVLVAA